MTYRSRISALITIFLGITVYACAPGSDKLERSEITVDDLERFALLHIPAVQEKLPLVVFLHGAGGSAEVAAENTGLVEESDRLGFMLAFPQALKDSQGITLWNANGCCGEPMRTGVDDLAFLDRLIGSMLKHYPVDAQRVFIAGYSNGGMLAYRAASALSRTVAGIVVVGGGMFNNQPPPTSAVSVFIVHGTSDRAVPYFGGPSEDPLIKKLSRSEFMSTEDTFEFWKSANQCQLEPLVKSHASFTEIRASHCKQSVIVKFWKLEDVGHGWPRSTAPDFFSTSRALGEFFEQAPSRGGDR